MNILKKDNYLCITDAESISAAAAACEAQLTDDVYAAVFYINSDITISKEEADRLLNMPVITAVCSDSMSSLSADVLLAFDIRFSESVFTVSRNQAEKLLSERFGVLFGSRKKQELSAFSENPSDEALELDYFSVTSESCGEYFGRIFREKSSFQIKALTECIVSLRTGITENGFAKESVNFYKLIKETAKE